jgi:hypothetical protein
MNMNCCPQCGQKRIAEEFKCPKCACFYSQLDEILAAQEAEIEQKSLQGHLKAIWNAEQPQQALRNELKSLRANTPQRTKFTLIVIGLFIFALIVSVL